MKKIVLIMIVFSCSLLSKNLEPKEMVNKFINISERAVKYKNENKNFAKKHINEIKDLLYSKSKRRAKSLLGNFRTAILSAKAYNKRQKYSLDMSKKILIWKPRETRDKRRGDIRISYTFYGYQTLRMGARTVYLKSKKINEDITKWYIY